MERRPRRDYRGEALLLRVEESGVCTRACRVADELTREEPGVTDENIGMLIELHRHRHVQLIAHARL